MKRKIMLAGVRLILPVSLLLMSGCMSLQAVDAGIYNVVGAVSEEDRVTGERSLSLAGRSGQIRQGNAAVEQLLRGEAKINAQLDAVQFARLTRLFDRVQRVSHLKAERWQAVLIDRPDFNAFTTGGTYIVVHLGLMQQLQDDDEVAAVIAHEVAHTVANHAFETQGFQTLATLTGSNSAARNGYQAAFTHENEREADRIAVLYSALAGFDPAAASRIWARQYRDEGNAGGLFFHTHPVNRLRAEETAATARLVEGYYRQGQENPDAAALLENNVLWQKRSNTMVAGQGGGVAALLGTTLGTYVQHQGVKQEESRQVQQQAVLSALMQQMQPLGETVIDQHSWQVRWRYTGPSALDNLVMGVLVKDQAGTVQRFIAQVPGTVQPGQAFDALFRSSQLSVGSFASMQLKYYVDDASPR
ncbi:M48 family metallopeptidase [Marinobacterium rhizophilum]|uniref:M48 family metallopeptidase n=1 Tax=Marinobacterium rhizophilum TaxID=420402 RepID=A0ABY5HHF5_9GAMM|nr:M48 family metallopeptidase [Marinobacterium rhizophilum]UTW10727.1 M48 family metallopeptidase [Marinobacterium rhizophilum]